MQEMSSEADIQATIRGWPSRESIVERSRHWETEHFDYAIYRVQFDTDPNQRERVEQLLIQLQSQRAMELKQAELLAKMEGIEKSVIQGPRPNWINWTTLALTAIAAVAGAISAIHVVLILFEQD